MSDVCQPGRDYTQLLTPPRSWAMLLNMATPQSDSAAGAFLAKRSAAAQGIPPKLANPVLLQRLAAMFAAPRAAAAPPLDVAA